MSVRLLWALQTRSVAFQDKMLMLLVFLWIHVCAGKAQEGTIMEGATPRLSEEDSLSKAIPLNHRCNVCKGIVFQLNHHFRAKGRRKLTESEVEEVYEEVCQGKNTLWQKYGAREIDGKPVLTGPGLLNPAPKPGQLVATQSGGIWADRLQMACLQLVDAVGEMELYDLYAQSGSYSGLDEETVCVRQRRFCEAKELLSINEQIQQQVKDDAGRNVQTTNSQRGFSTEKEKRHTKPVDPKKSKKSESKTVAVDKAKQEKEAKEALERRLKALRREIRSTVDSLGSLEALQNVLQAARQEAEAAESKAGAEEEL